VAQRRLPSAQPSPHANRPAKETIVNTRSRPVIAAAIALRIALIVIAVVYWVEPAKSLPSFFPGQKAGSNHHHRKHGIAAFLIGLACLVFAWFQTGPNARRRAA
jgi:hypothetical protein